MVFEKIQEIIADKLGLDADEITLESSIKDDLNADSLDLYEIVTGIEEEFDVEVPTEALGNMNTVKDMVEYMESLHNRIVDVNRLSDHCLRRDKGLQFL